MAGAEFRYVTTQIYQAGATRNGILAELPFTNVNFTNQLNSVGTFNGHVLLSGLNSNELNAYDGTIPGKTILWVLYSDPVTLDTRPVWSGVIWAREYDSASQTLSITAQEMMSLYGRRRISTTKNYATSFFDPAFIAYDLMQYAESLPRGNTGLTYNSITTPFATKKLYESYELKSVYQAIKDLASQFFDFSIKPKINLSGQLYNEFTLGYPLGTTYSATNRNSFVLQFPGNLVSYNFPEDASQAANKLYGLGYGANNKKIIAIASDPTKISGTATWPLLEDTANYIDIGDNQLLKDVTLGQLNATSYPPTTIEAVIPPYVDPYYPDYQVGDQVRLNIQDSYFPSGLNLTMRIMAITVNPGENGPSRITITLTRELAAGIVV